MRKDFYIQTVDEMIDFEKNHIHNRVGRVLIGEKYKLNYIPENINSIEISIISQHVTKLPKYLTCDGLYISNTYIEEIYSTNEIKHVILAKDMKCNLKLPENLSLESLILRNSYMIDKLPDNLYIKQYLDIQGTQITSIPDGTYVKYGIESDIGKFVPDVFLYSNGNSVLKRTCP